MLALVLILVLELASAPCADWCNAHTCGKGDCMSCETCALLAAGKHCESYCNSYTCHDHKCGGCHDCAKEAPPVHNSTSHAQTPAVHARPAPGWGCCADREAASCDSCRFWAKGGFCEKHAVNCATCGFSVFCADPASTPPPAPPAPPPAEPLDMRCESGRLVDCRGGSCRDFVLKGVSWFGMEEKYHVLQGLERVPMKELLDFVAGHGFNAIRVPLSVTGVLDDPVSSQFGGMLGQQNPAMHEIRYLKVLDKLIHEASARSLGVLLDMHRLSAGDRNNPLWHDASVGEEKLLAAWHVLARRYCGAWNVIGADIFNEPWAASWGHGPAHEDWAKAAERIGAAVSHACPRWLLFVEGVSHTTSSGEPAAGPGQSEFGHNWASNLEGVRSRPLRLTDPSKLVYSPHIYGPSVAPQAYFEAADFPANMPAIWEAHFGFVSSRQLGCVVVGEWGGWFSGTDATWQKAFAAWLSKRQMGTFYWALNPTSRDTGGLVLADWRSPSSLKLAMLGAMPVTTLISVASAAAESQHDHEYHSKHVHEMGTQSQTQHSGGSHGHDHSGQHPSDSLLSDLPYLAVPF